MGLLAVLRRSRLFTALAVLAALLAGIAAGWVWMTRPSSLPPVSLTVAMPVQVSSGALYVAQEHGLFARNGLSVKLLPFLIGKQALQSVLDSRADLAFVADTPFMLAVMRGEQVSVLATVFESRRTMAVFANRDRGVSSASALAGKIVGTVPGTNAEYFLDTFLDMHGIARAAVSIVGLRPEQLAPALAAGNVDAVTLWHPELARIEQEYGARGVTLYGEDYFVYRFLLVGKKSFIEAHPAQVSRFLATLDQSNRMIRADPARVQALLGQRLDLRPDLLTRSFGPNDFTLVLDQPLLLALSDQARWAEAKRIVPAQKIPDFLSFVFAGPLTAIAPDANKIIR